MTYLRATTVGLTMAVVAPIVFSVCEFIVKYAVSVIVNGGVGNSPGASMAIPSPLSVVAAVAGCVYGFRWALKRATPREAHR